MVKDQLNWEGSAGDYARLIMQVEMAKRDMSYRELTEKINAKFKITENERNIRNRVARGTFTAGFFLMCLIAMDCKQIEINPIEST
jgi:hypothetical protein